MRGSSPVPFGKGLSEKDPRHGHLVGGLFHSEGGTAAAMRRSYPTRPPRARSAWTITRSATGPAGTGTSCSP